MKAGILTFHKADNYGAVLQAYALQKTLERMGIASEFVEFEEPPVREHSPTVLGSGGSFAEKIRAGKKARHELFDRFRRNRLQCSSAYCPEDAKRLDNAYDVFIAGSDQIWNARLPEADGRYFLPFAPPDKKISYAASFGMDQIPAELRERYAHWLGTFRALSVREEQGRKLVKELTGRDCTVCLDPVLLPEREDWETLTHRENEKSYLFLYMVGYDRELAAGARKTAEERGLELKTVTAGFLPQYGLEAWSGAGVEEWLSLIRNAAAVYTNSFHCTAFSLIFGCPVSTALLKDGLSQRNGRLEELLQMAGREGAAEEDEMICDTAFMERISHRRQMSLDYLKQALTAEQSR